MLKGLAITPPVVGRISIGRVVERNGKRLPEKSDEFQLTSQVQNRDGWVLHPLDEALRQANGGGKLRAIPVRVLFKDPDLNLRAEYSIFDRETGRPMCVGNGESCKRVTDAGIESLPCPSPDGCAFGQKGGCKPYGRLNVVIGDEDELGAFIFRTTSFNSIRTLAARLRYFSAVSGGLLATMPLELKLRGKSTTQSYRSAVFYVDIVARSGMALEEAIARAWELDGQRKAVIRVGKWCLVALGSLILFAWGADVPMERKVQWAMELGSPVAYGWMYFLLGAVLSSVFGLVITIVVMLGALLVVGRKALSVEFRFSTFRDAVPALWLASAFGALVGIGPEAAPPFVLVVALGGLVYYRSKSAKTKSRGADASRVDISMD